MSWGSIIVTILNEKMDTSKFIIPEVPDFDENHPFSIAEVKTLSQEILLLWDKLEKYYHIQDELIRYDKDRDASLEYWCCTAQYYTKPFFRIVRIIDKKLQECRMEASINKWSSNNIHLFSDLYMIRYNIVGHLRYLRTIHPLLINFSISDSLNSYCDPKYDGAMIPAKNYQYSAGPVTRYLAYIIWKIKLKLHQNNE